MMILLSMEIIDIVVGGFYTNSQHRARKIRIILKGVVRFHLTVLTVEDIHGFFPTFYNYMVNDGASNRGLLPPITEVTRLRNRHPYKRIAMSKVIRRVGDQEPYIKTLFPYPFENRIMFF